MCLDLLQGRRNVNGFARTVHFLIYIRGWRKMASSRFMVACLPWMRILCGIGNKLFSPRGSFRSPMGIGVSRLGRGGCLMVTGRTIEDYCLLEIKVQM